MVAALFPRRRSNLPPPSTFSLSCRLVVSTRENLEIKFVAAFFHSLPLSVSLLGGGGGRNGFSTAATPARSLHCSLSLSPCRNLGGRRRRATFATDGRPRPREGRRDGAGNGTGRSWNHAILALWSRRTDGRSRKNQELSWSTMKVELTKLTKLQIQGLSYLYDLSSVYNIYFAELRFLLESILKPK